MSSLILVEIFDMFIKYLCTPKTPIIEGWDIRQTHRSKSKEKTKEKDTQER